jgi:hypothetical protein
MAQAVHAALVRLREADVVRLCGLDAAARGLELASRAAVRGARRMDARLEAVVADERTCAVWVESDGEAPSIRLRWGCDCHTADPRSGEGGESGEATLPALGCAHVAAVLTAWIRAPADFIAPAEPAPPSGKERDGEAAHTPRAHLSQPALLRAGRSQSVTGGRATLADELARLSTQDLAAIARRVLGQETADAETRMQLAAALGDPHLVAALLGRLEAGARALLTDILLMGGAMTTADLDGLASRAGRPASALRAEAAVLERHGLLFPASGGAMLGQATAGQSGHSWREVAGWRVPPEVRAALPLALPLAPLAADSPGPPPLPSGDDGPSLAGARTRYARLIRASPRQLCLALALLALAPRPFNPFEAADPAPTRLPRPRASTTAPSSAPFPLAPGDLPAATLAELARGAGLPPALVVLARRVLLWARAAGMASALAAIPHAPPAEAGFALRAAFRLWRDAESAAELADLPLMETGPRAAFDSEHAALRPAALAAEIAAARAEIVRLVALAQPGVWYPLAGFLDLLWRVHPHYLRGRQLAYARPAWWLERSGEPPRPLRVEARDEWMAADGAFARGLLAGALHWWGALDLAAGPDGLPVAFRLTPVGRFLLADDTGAPGGELRAALAGEWGAPVLLTRAAALAAQPMAAAPDLMDALAVWARPTAIAGGRLVYTLAPDLACAALDRGVGPDVLLERLRNADGGRAAAAIEPHLRRWQAEYGKTRIEAGWALLEAESEAALAEALAYMPALAARCRRIAPALALVPAGEVPALAAALSRRGYHL